MSTLQLHKGSKHPGSKASNTCRCFSVSIVFVWFAHVMATSRSVRGQIKLLLLYEVSDRRGITDYLISEKQMRSSYIRLITFQTFFCCCRPVSSFGIRIHGCHFSKGFGRQIASGQISPVGTLQGKWFSFLELSEELGEDIPNTLLLLFVCRVG